MAPTATLPDFAAEWAVKCDNIPRSLLDESHWSKENENVCP
jgi:hypothetical protein